MRLIKKFTINDNFFTYYEELMRDVVIPYQEKVLKDEVEGAEKSHCIENFRQAAQVLKTGHTDGEFYGMVFQDSDAAKWLEAAAYLLILYPNTELEKRCDEVIDIIAEAQHSDGYLNTYFTVKEPDKRWTNLEEAHELYCAGHMIEAAVAYYNATGKSKLLDVICKMSDHIYRHFITEGAEGFPGHPEIELALMRLFKCTSEENYLQLARHFIDVRGVDSDFFIKESQKHKWTVWGNNPHDKEYTQNHLPVREQTRAVGHSVRAVYLYTAMADCAAQIGDESLKSACRTLWENIVNCQMYVTGAIGSAYEGEAFTKDYHLPNDTAYAETCAAIGLIFFAKKMLSIEKKSCYADVMERALYNCVLAGIGLDGKSFFYVNPLEVIPNISGEAKTHQHTLPTRPGWFFCACCPPNVARLLTSLAEYAWESEGKTIYSHLFIGGTLNLTDTHGGKIHVSSDLPYDGTVEYKFEPTDKSMEITLAIRLPFWSKSTEILLNGESTNYTERDGYAYISSIFSADDKITINFDMSIRRIYANPKAYADNSKVAFSRGPLVYCAEGLDNDGDVLSLVAKKNGKLQTCKNTTDIPNITLIEVEGLRLQPCKDLYTFNQLEHKEEIIRMIPYFAWANRGKNQMRVWIPEG